jgi:curved DNA-binding protein CbpA
VNQNPISRLPRPVEGVDMRALPIGPEEAFVLSRVDGRSSEADIVAATGIDGGRVRQSLKRLADLGAIRYDSAEPPRQSPSPAAATASPRSVRLERPVIEAGRPGLGAHAHAAAALYDPSELDEEVDLDLPRKRKILDLYYRLDSVTHYELLEVAPTADKKAIRDAYFGVVNVFHPDRYFGKRLGSFKPKLERIFQRLTEAHELLSRKKTRDEYDEYLTSQQRSKNLEQMMSAEREAALELERVRRRIEEEARASERARHTPQPLDEETRRKVLARKLGVSHAPPRAPTSSVPLVDQQALRERVAGDLKRRHAERLTQAQASQVRHYVEASEQALRENDAVSAANALRIAASLAPDDAALATRLHDLERRVGAELAQAYTEQAHYEERSGHFAEAARSYEKAAYGKPSARLFERAAYCLLQTGGDLRRAAEHAKKAIELAADDPASRVTLARVFLAGNMRQSAQAELERAATLAPNDDNVKDLIRRLKRGEL